uniref:Uncharacterized protein n=1 Tax=Anguilla anguilla TaxID=7936 RepID=A0A0E9RNY1_ANGAN
MFYFSSIPSKNLGGVEGGI